jgi:bifunctional non-homologous end joining protein LigD
MRVLYPETGFTKADAIAYYRTIGKSILPHLRKRPLSFKRYPDTIRNESFWEKDAPGFTPQWVKRFQVPRRSGESAIEYIVVSDVRTLTWVADVGGIELHPFLHVIPNIAIATHVVFDLDPGEGADITDCCVVALVLRDALAAIHLESFAKVSGSKGLQVYVPVTAPHAATEPFARFVAEELAKRHPKLVTAKMGKQFRRGKVFIDWSQNADFKTTVAVYSLRAKQERPLVSMPVTWDEVRRARKLAWEPDEAIARVRKVGDLFAGVLKGRKKLEFPAVHATRAKAPVRPPQSIPRARSQSGRRLFVLHRDELWTEMRGKFKRWILRPDRDGGPELIAMPAGEFAIDPAYYRGELPVVDSGAYEIIEGSYQRNRFDLWFSGATMRGHWTLEKAGEGRSWRLYANAPR